MHLQRKALSLLAVSAILITAVLPVSAREPEALPPMDYTVRERIESAKEKTEAMIAKSEQHIATLENHLESQLDKDLKLVYEHITYSDRLVARKNDFIIHNPSRSGTRSSTATLDLRKRSAITNYEIEEYVLKGTPLEGLGRYFIEAEIEYGVNAVFLLSLAILESGWGRSAIARDKNNLFGFGSYDASPYRSSRTFSSKRACILYVARFIKENYLTESGKYFHGYTLADVNKRYSSDPNWWRKVGSLMQSINQKIIDSQNTGYHREILNDGVR